MGRREVRRAGTALDREHYGLKAMKEGCIHWHAVKLKVVNRSQKMRDWLKRGERQGIMARSGRAKDGGCRRILSAIESPIYVC